ncbi:MAG: hypothetical protein CMI26_05170 [Opitutae bacterium]|nr:hypothetical protein [Opitutae bacterium]
MANEGLFDSVATVVLVGGVSEKSKIISAEIPPKLLFKTEAYMRLSGWDENDMVKHALATLFEAAESQDYPPAIPDPCLALGKLIRASQLAESGRKLAPEDGGGSNKKGLTFQPFSKNEVDDALAHIIPGASSWMVELEKKKGEEKGADDSTSRPAS